MAITDKGSSWDKIRQGARDAETLFEQKKYNLSLMKCRQVVEYMVRSQCEKARILEPDLAASIDSLYQNRFITKTTCEHYHKIRMLGNRAVHEGSDNAYDANQAVQLMKQEVNTFFGGPSRETQAPPRRRQTAAPAPSRSSSSAHKSRKRSERNNGFSSTDLMRFFVVIVVVVVLIALIRFIVPDKEKNTETSSAITTESSMPQTETPTEPETMTETTAAPLYRVNADLLNVRADPSTSGRKLGGLTMGAAVEYLGDYDDEWAIILYEGAEAYVAKQYLIQE